MLAFGFIVVHRSLHPADAHRFDRVGDTTKKMRLFKAKPARQRHRAAMLSFCKTVVHRSLHPADAQRFDRAGDTKIENRVTFEF